MPKSFLNSDYGKYRIIPNRHLGYYVQQRYSLFGIPIWRNFNEWHYDYCSNINFVSIEEAKEAIEAEIKTRRSIDQHLSQGKVYYP